MAFHEWDDGPTWRTMWERQGQTVFVTGAQTALGAKVVERLAASGWTVRVLVSVSQFHHPYPRRVIPVVGSLSEPSSLLENVRDCRAVVHLQECTASRDEQQYIRENVDYTRSLVSVCREVKISQIILLSSASVEMRRASHYIHSKKVAEDVVRGSGLDWTIVRPSLLVGVEGGSEYQWLRKMVRRFGVIPLPEGGHAVQRPVHEDDLAEGIDLLLRASASTICRRTYHLSGRQSLTVADLVQLIIHEHGWSERRLLKVPGWICWWAARIADRVFKSPYEVTQLLRFIMEDADHDSDAASQDFGFRPRPLAGRLATLHILDHLRHVAKPSVAPARVTKGFSIIRRNTR